MMVDFFHASMLLSLKPRLIPTTQTMELWHKKERQSTHAAGGCREAMTSHGQSQDV
jgi:hypothetical protein